MCTVLVGLPDVTIIEFGDWPSWLRIVVRVDAGQLTCSHNEPACRRGLHEVVLVDVPRFGRATRLVWHSNVADARRAAAAGAMPTRRSRRRDARGRPEQRGGRRSRSAATDTLSLTPPAIPVAAGTRVMDVVVAAAAQLIDHPDLIGTVTTLGLDETLLARVGRFRATAVVDPDRRRSPR